MIELKLNAKFDFDIPPFVIKINSLNIIQADYDGFVKEDDGKLNIITKFGSIELDKPSDSIKNNIIICFPRSSKILRCFRADSVHNSLMLTERCDQLCVMCSQPPRKTNDEWRFSLFADAMLLAPLYAVFTLSGGEPTIYKNELFELLEKIADNRPDLSINILSNGQHLSSEDAERLTSIHSKLKVQWGIPIYSSDPDLHNQIVDKPGAFDRAMNAIYLIASTGGLIELRTVVMAPNALALPSLAKFIAKHLSFINYWALMAMEPIGFAKANLKDLLFDHSVANQPITRALEVCDVFGVDYKLFNFPLCTIKEKYRQNAVQSISDWKRKYLDICEMCELKSRCTGFFEWYSEKSSWENIIPTRSVL